MIDTSELGWEIQQTINHAGNNAPRSLQRSIGPSEVGAPCIRKIGYRLLQVDTVNQSDTWLATIGTAVHAWLADQYTKLNTNPDAPRFLVEQRVQITDELGGSVDLFDIEKKLVIDWKVVGDSSLKRYKKEGVGPQYRTQAHLYAYGLMRAGYVVDDVAIVFLPRGGSLRGLWIWTEPFDITIAAAGVDRLNAAKEIVAAGGSRALQLLTPTDSHCHYCPYFLPASTDLLIGCPGGDAPTQPNPTTGRR